MLILDRNRNPNQIAYYVCNQQPFQMADICDVNLTQQDLWNYIRTLMNIKIWILIAIYSVEGISVITTMANAV